jgi:hypothetical protein
VAAKFPLLDQKIVNKRSKRLTELYKSYLPNAHFLHQYIQVYTTNQESKYQNKSMKKMYVSHDKYYNQVIVPTNRKNQKIWVKIIDVKRFHMKGRLLYFYEYILLDYFNLTLNSILLTVLFAYWYTILNQF